MKHGPIAIIEEGMPVLAVAVKSRILDKMVSNIQEAKARGGHLVVITNEGAELHTRVDDLLVLPETDEYFSPMFVRAGRLLPRSRPRLEGICARRRRGLWFSFHRIA